MTHNFSNTNYIEPPKKQAKSYELDLGQNSGPYKEELLIRYGDNTLQSMLSKISQTKGNMNMEEIMKMNEVLKPYQERSKEIDEDNFRVKCFQIECTIADSEDLSLGCKNFEENLNKAIELMTNDIFKCFDEAYNEFNPNLLEKYKFLKKMIKDQKDENSNLMKQIDLINQEISQLFENIIKLGTRLENIEKVCGIDKDEFDNDEDN